MSWIDAMVLDGLSVWITPDRRVGIADATSDWRWGPAPLLRRARYLRVGDVDTLPAAARRSLLVARQMTRPARAALSSAGIAWALDDGCYHVGDRRGAHPLVADLPEPGKADLLAAVALLLSEDPQLTQRHLAAKLSVSQPRVHVLLRRLAATSVDRYNRKDLLAVWRSAHHEPPAEVQHWVSDASAWDQIARAYEILESARHSPVVGGEPAADQLTAWARPATAAIHAKGLRPLGAPFVPAAVPDEATLTVKATTDPLVHALATERDGPVGVRRIAHPAIVVRDLLPLAQHDDRVAEVVDRLAQWSPVRGTHAAG
jgi:hypothetical protein